MNQDNNELNTPPQSDRPFEPIQSTEHPQASSNQPLQARKSNKKLMIAAIILFVVLATAIGALIYLLSHKDPANTTSTNNANTSNSTQPTDTSTTNSTKKIISTQETSTPDVQLLIYQPKQTNTGTVFQYGMKNNCKGCNNTKFVMSPLVYIDKNNTYLLDEENGQKYSVLVDDDGAVVKSPSCNKYLTYNQVNDCFISFTKVPSGSTVKFVSLNTSVENITIP